MEEALGVYGYSLMQEMFGSIARLFTPRDDELSRIITAIQLFLLRTVIDPQWGAFLARTAHLARNTELVDRVRAYLQVACQKGVLRFDDALPATSLVIGTVIEAVRHISRTELRSRDYVDEITAMLLHGLGIDQAEAHELVRDRTIYIRGLAPDRLDWWVDPWIRPAEERLITERRSVG